MPNPLNAPDVGCREMGATAFWCKSLYLSLSPTSRVDKAVGSGFAGAGVTHSVLSVFV